MSILSSSVDSRSLILSTIRSNMTKSGCSEESIVQAQNNYLSLSSHTTVKVAVL